VSVIGEKSLKKVWKLQTISRRKLPKNFRILSEILSKAMTPSKFDLAGEMRSLTWPIQPELASKTHVQYIG
jgi:hypothetical protein